MISYFGTYRGDEAGKKIAFCIEASSFPNFDVTSQTRDIAARAAGLRKQVKEAAARVERLARERLKQKAGEPQGGKSGE